MGALGREFVTTDESPIRAKSLSDPIVMKDGQNDGGFADSSGTDQGDRREAFRKINDPVDQRVPSTEDPWRRRREHPRYTRCRCQASDLLVAEIACLSLAQVVVSKS